MIFPIRITKTMRRIAARAEPYLGAVLLYSGALIYIEGLLSENPNTIHWVSDQADQLFYEDFEAMLDELEEGSSEEDNIREGYRRGLEISKELAKEIVRTYEFDLRVDGQPLYQQLLTLVEMDEDRNIIVVEI